MNELTKQERINSDPLALMIISIVSAMKADYGDKFKRQFEQTDDLDQFKRRLYQKLKGLEIECIIDGYELCAGRNSKFVPTVIELVSCVLEVVKAKAKRIESDKEAARVAALPAPTINCDPLKMLADTIEKFSGDSESERAKRRDANIQHHNAVLEINGAKIIKRHAEMEHLCHANGCRKAGTMSHSTVGGLDFYCSDHFRRA